MTPQPSSEAVALVRAALMAEREITNYEDIRIAGGLSWSRTPKHVALVKAGDDATEALFQKITQDEQDAARYRKLRALLFNDFAWVEGELRLHSPETVDRLLDALPEHEAVV